MVADGVGLRNFAFGDFCKTAESQGFEVTFWNDTPFDLASLGYNEIKIRGSKTHPMAQLLKNVRIKLDLDRNIRKSKDRVYDSYRFKSRPRNLSQFVRSALTKILFRMYNSDKAIDKVRRNIMRCERSTPFFDRCLETLRNERPDLVFCTNQRNMISIAPILAAQQLGIPTATFIFSWDNLPKATMMLETDYYLVWSDQMKKELMHYYEYIGESQVFVTGTPQFEPHSAKNIIVPRDVFFAENGLDIAKKYICFSGDDVTTSPNDPQYLADTAEAIRALNANGENIGLVFRRCPVDFSDRYDSVISKYRDIIVPVNPKWQKAGGAWNTILPTQADLELQMNTIAHTEMVVNLGSSMVFDYALFNKPCAYINYDVRHSANTGWRVENIYKFVHFRSMPSKNAVVWLNDPGEIAAKIASALSSDENVKAANSWFGIINRQPSQDASKRICSAFEKILLESQSI